MRALFTALFGLVVLCAGVRAPLAADMTEDAKTYFDAGRQAYEAGRYAVAASAFEEAYRLSPKPQVLFSLAQAHRQQFLVDRDGARLSRAIELFRQYLREVPMGGRHDHAQQHLADLEKQVGTVTAGKGSPLVAPMKLEAKTQLMITSRTPGALATFGAVNEEPSDLPVIRDVLSGKHRVHVEAEGFIPEDVEGVAVDGRLVVVDVTLKERPAYLMVEAPDGADIALDGRLVGTAPLATALEVSSGKHLVVVTERGSYGFAKEVTLGRGEERTIEAKLETTTQRTISYWFLGGAGALLAGGAVVGVVALRAEGRAKEIDDMRTSRQGLTLEDVRDYRRNVELRDRVAPASALLLGTGAVVAVTGALLYLIDSPRVDVERTGAFTGARASVTPIVAPGTVGAAFSTSF